MSVAGRGAVSTAAWSSRDPWPLRRASGWTPRRAARRRPCGVGVLVDGPDRGEPDDLLAGTGDEEQVVARGGLVSDARHALVNTRGSNGATTSSRQHTGIRLAVHDRLDEPDGRGVGARATRTLASATGRRRAVVGAVVVPVLVSVLGSGRAGGALLVVCHPGILSGGDSRSGRVSRGTGFGRDPPVSHTGRMYGNDVIDPTCP